MHELSIARNIIAEVEDAARRNDVADITNVTVQVGRLCGVVAGALTFGFELAREGTLLAEAELIIEDEPVVVWCPEGDHTVELADMIFRCPDHGCPTPEILSGKGMEILRFEVADPTTESSKEAA